MLRFEHIIRWAMLNRFELRIDYDRAQEQYQTTWPHKKRPWRLVFSYRNPMDWKVKRQMSIEAWDYRELVQRVQYEAERITLGLKHIKLEQEHLEQGQLTSFFRSAENQ